MQEMKSLDLILSELRGNGKRLSEKSFEYVYINHSSKNILVKLKEYILNTNLTLNDIYEYRSKKPIWNKISYYLMKVEK